MSTDSSLFFPRYACSDTIVTPPCLESSNGLVPSQVARAGPSLSRIGPFSLHNFNCRWMPPSNRALFGSFGPLTSDDAIGIPPSTARGRLTLPIGPRVDFFSHFPPGSRVFSRFLQRRRLRECGPPPTPPHPSFFISVCHIMRALVVKIACGRHRLLFVAPFGGGFS